MHQSITALNWGQDHGRDPSVGRGVQQPRSPAPGCFQQRQPTHKVSVCSALPSAAPSLEPLKNSAAKRKQAFKNKKETSRGLLNRSLAAPTHVKIPPEHAERSFKGWITARGWRDPPRLPFRSLSAASTLCASNPDRRAQPKRGAQPALCRLDWLRGAEERQTCCRQRARAQATQKRK